MVFFFCLLILYFALVLSVPRIDVVTAARLTGEGEYLVFVSISSLVLRPSFYIYFMFRRMSVRVVRNSHDSVRVVCLLSEGRLPCTWSDWASF